LDIVALDYSVRHFFTSLASDSKGIVVMNAVQEPELEEDEQSTSDSSDAGDDLEVAAVNGSDLSSDDDNDEDNNAEAAAAAVASASESESSSSDDELGPGAAIDVVTESDDEEVAELLEKRLLGDTASGPSQVSLLVLVREFRLNVMMNICD